MNELSHLSLFSGIGGIDLAAEWAGFESIGQCEMNEYARKVLQKNFGTIPRWRDVRDVTKESFWRECKTRELTLLSGGFPCQPFSVAGKQRGEDDDRFLWPEMLRVVSELRPTWAIGENVGGFVSMALDNVLTDLENINYETRAFLLPACAVGAPHRRDRCFIVAHTNGTRRIRGEYSKTDRCRCSEFKSETEILQSDKTNAIPHTNEIRCDLRGFEREGIHRNKARHETDSGGETISNADSPQREGGELPIRSTKEHANTGGRGRWTSEPAVGRVADGVPSRVDRLRCLGNAVVPQQVYPILKYIAEIEQQTL